MNPTLRMLIPFFMLFMGWALWQLFDGTLPPSFGIVVGYVFLVCLVTFQNFVKVFTYGYALNMIGGPMVIAVLFGVGGSAWLFAGLLVAYGLRLLVFQVQRGRARSYAGHLQQQKEAHASMPVPVRVLIYLFTSLLLLFYVTILFMTRDVAAFQPVTLAGLGCMAAGLVLETLADLQKQRVKQTTGGYASEGLYRRVRHPNYLGEVVFHAGALLYGLPLVEGWLHVAVCAVSPVYLILLMVLSARGLDVRMQENHGERPGFAEYYERSWSILPGVL